MAWMRPRPNCPLVGKIVVRFSNENTNGATACCLAPVDLAFAKLAAGREKDLDFVAELSRHHLIKPSILLGFIEQIEDQSLKNVMAERWQIVQSKRRILEQPSQSIRPPGIRM